MTAYNSAFDLRFLRGAGFIIDDIKCLMKTATKYSKYKDKNGRVKKQVLRKFIINFHEKRSSLYRRT
jgi:hypothetical protein